MTPKPPALHGALALATALLVGGAGASVAGHALAQPGWLRRALTTAQTDAGRRPAPPPVARYAVDEGGVFILDRSASPTLIRFEDNPEVWVLYPARGPRGDMIYRNDMGETVLRATKLGGMTVFTPRRPEGAAAGLIGPTAPLRLTPLGPVGLYQRLLQASARVSRSAQHLVGFDALAANPTSDALIADAAAVTAAAMVNLASRPGGRVVVARVSRVNFSQGANAQVAVQSGIVTVVVAPSRGIAGRPSSARIIQMLGR
ncbi:MAG: DUF4908 domain-containing protein [Caulobacteraceae bacterium]